ncbi:hypothetical protein VTN00DRAFT_6617 [Thermoascus crustaceus]|uniref:uncharacterized protein n=1 Tax=Thermoascus crustaceus TaxID=5088 RepID=UPI00374320A0
MTDQDSSYRPRSPDFSSFQTSFPPYTPYPLTSPIAHRASYDASPFFTPQYQRPHDDDMARRSSRVSWQQQQPEPPIVQSKPIDPSPADEPAKRPGAGIEVKTKFPVARIKRIMQADEDVGKVAQVTPIAVSKALELFMISLVTKAAQEAKDRNSKRVTAAHLKQAVAKDEVLDFLADIIAKVPDAPARKHDDDGSDHNEGGRRRRVRKKEESD